MKKRVAGGVVLVAIGIGIWLSNLFTGIGPGGAGTNIGMNPEVSVRVDNGTATRRTETSEASADGTSSSDSGRPVVVIDEQEYFLEQRSGETTTYVPATLEQIVELAANAEADNDGIRVQIKRRGSSRPSAEAALDQALFDSGITEEQIQRHAGFVE